jgi:hypothetical protein
MTLLLTMIAITVFIANDSAIPNPFWYFVLFILTGAALDWLGIFLDKQKKEGGK